MKDKKMFELNINKDFFRFKYLPEYSAYLLKNKIEEFVTVGIRFARQYDLPMMKPLARISEKELTKMSLDSNREILQALAENNIVPFIEKNTQNWIQNKLGVIDQNDVLAEDLTLAYFIRRKTFAHFLYSYSPNPAIHQLITEEVDAYTTQEEVINLRAYLYLHQKELH
jgi:hypothetical protein